MNVAVVLAGGLGTRIEALAKGRPKVLLPLGGADFLEWKLAEFYQNKIDSVFLLTGKGSMAISASLSVRDSAVPVAMVDDGPTLRGTGGALLRALAFLPDNFFLTYGDTLLDISYEEITRFSNLDPERRSVLVVSRPQNGVDGRCNTAIEGDLVKSHSKVDVADKDWIDFGISLLNRDHILDLGISETRFDLSEIYSRLAERQQLRALPTEALYYEIGTPESFDYVERHLVDKSARSN
ncbi:Nucleotidyl transferase [mine drainage metagenome]|uniref:Bifunctional protein GlmU n=2 Tax=root TaxID=1 RepID=A0A0D8HFP4_9ACTN|nr:NTP transferase domain-containing protein [Acidithrix ferrooxidans]KJF16748.1 bifunctional protein GlmU [Acidithrix ferrooxidans]